MPMSLSRSIMAMAAIVALLSALQSGYQLASQKLLVQGAMTAADARFRPLIVIQRI